MGQIESITLAVMLATAQTTTAVDSVKHSAAPQTEVWKRNDESSSATPMVLAMSRQPDDIPASENKGYAGDPEEGIAKRVLAPKVVRWEKEEKSWKTDGWTQYTEIDSR